MKNGLDTFLRLVRQAKDSVEVETNTDIGYQQLQTAQKIYPQAVRVNGRSFRIHVADWSARGKNWAELERAQGLDLDQIKDAAYRKDFPKPILRWKCSICFPAAVLTMIATANS